MFFLYSHRCVCLPGFTGQNCGVNINDCLTNPCQLYQECIDGVNSYVCQCPVGFTGSRCDVNINECLSQPCLNNGTCQDGKGKPIFRPDLQSDQQLLIDYDQYCYDHDQH